MNILYQNRSIVVSGLDVDKKRFFGLLSYGFNITEEQLPSLLNEMFELEGNFSYNTPVSFNVSKHGHSYRLRLMEEINNVPLDKVYYELVFDLSDSNYDRAVITLIENKIRKKRYEIRMKVVKRKPIYFNDLNIELR